MFGSYQKEQQKEELCKSLVYLATALTIGSSGNVIAVIATVRKLGKSC